MNKTISLSTGRRADQHEQRKSALAPPSLSCGLTRADVAKSEKLYGKNRVEAKKTDGFLKQFFQNLNDPIIKILLFALGVNLVFTFRNANWAESIGIAITVFVSALVTTLSEHSSGAAFEKLYATLDDSTCRVIRDGEEKEIKTSALVRYDLVFLTPGETVPADGILLRGSLSCDESALTGESRPSDKQPNPSLLAKLRTHGDAFSLSSSPAALFSGSHILTGSGIMLVTAVGGATVYGAIAGELSADRTASPLKDRLSALAKTISKIGYISAAVVAAVHLADSFWFDLGQNPTLFLARIGDWHFVLSELIHALTLAISVIVVAVPEGLPMMITVVLSSNMKRMLKSGVLVRRLVGIETSGGVDMLFTDKTGTLTTGKLTVSSFLTADGEHHAFSSCPNEVKFALRAAAEACSGVFNPTERAMNSFVGVRLREASPDLLPFDSSRKFAAGIQGGKLYLRGAADYLLPHCSTFLSADGDTVLLDDARRSHLEHQIVALSSSSCRILLVARGEESFFPLLRQKTIIPDTLVFVGLYVIRDEIRKEALPAVRECQKAGIQVVMLTGDNASTAAGIAREVGILSPSYQVVSPTAPTEAYRNTDVLLDGSVLASLSDESVIALLPSLRVVSRVTPTDKSRLVRLAKENGHITGMTGDGVNDAPALKSADVGFAMGSGTDVAREAGDIVITDDNFVSITRAILYGRTIFSSIRKFITFQLTMNMAAVGVSVIGTMFGIESPVTVIQMLWVNMIMDTLGSLAFAGEPALPSFMETPPLSRNEPILSHGILLEMILTGGYAILVSLFFLLSPSIRLWLGGSELHHLTRFFALFIFMGIAIAFCTRTPRLNLLAGLGKNRAFLIIMPAVALIQLLIIYFGGDTFRCVPLSLEELKVSALFALSVIPVDLIRKSVYGIIANHKQTKKGGIPM